MTNTEIYELHRSDAPASSTVEATYDNADEAIAQAQREAESEDMWSRTVYEVVRFVTEAQYEIVWSSRGQGGRGQ